MSEERKRMLRRWRIFRLKCFLRSRRVCYVKSGWFNIESLKWLKTNLNYYNNAFGLVNFLFSFIIWLGKAAKKNKFLIQITRKIAVKTEMKRINNEIIKSFFLAFFYFHWNLIGSVDNYYLSRSAPGVMILRFCCKWSC